MFHYKDVVLITDGFYKGMTGRVMDKKFNPFRYRTFQYVYNVSTCYGYLDIPTKHLSLIKTREQDES